MPGKGGLTKLHQRGREFFHSENELRGKTAVGNQVLEADSWDLVNVRVVEDNALVVKASGRCCEPFHIACRPPRQQVTGMVFAIRA